MKWLKEDGRGKVWGQRKENDKTIKIWLFKSLLALLKAVLTHSRYTQQTYWEDFSKYSRARSNLLAKREELKRQRQTMFVVAGQRNCFSISILSLPSLFLAPTLSRMFAHLSLFFSWQWDSALFVATKIIMMLPAWFGVRSHSLLSNVI